MKLHRIPASPGKPLYINECDETQKVLETYGGYEFLKTVYAKYDPHRQVVFCDWVILSSQLSPLGSMSIIPKAPSAYEIDTVITETQNFGYTSKKRPSATRAKTLLHFDHSILPDEFIID